MVPEGDFSHCGIQTGPLATLQVHFVLSNINLFYLYIGRPILITQEIYIYRCNIEKREMSKLQKWMRQGNFSAWGIQTGSFAALEAHFVLEIFNLFHIYTWRPILITPKGY